MFFVFDILFSFFFFFFFFFFFLMFVFILFLFFVFCFLVVVCLFFFYLVLGFLFVVISYLPSPYSIIFFFPNTFPQFSYIYYNFQYTNPYTTNSLHFPITFPIFPFIYTTISNLLTLKPQIPFISLFPSHFPSQRGVCWRWYQVVTSPS